MLKVDNRPNFIKKISKIKNNSLKEQAKKRIKKVIQNPNIGKPMKHDRKGTREIYIGSFRLSYVYLPHENKIIFLDLYHKDEQ